MCLKQDVNKCYTYRGLTYYILPREEPDDSQISNKWGNEFCWETTSSGFYDYENDLESYDSLGGSSESYDAIAVHELLKKWILTKDQRNENGYPGHGGSREKLSAVIPATKYDSQKLLIDREEKYRVCSRCGKVFKVEDDGLFQMEFMGCHYSYQGRIFFKHHHVIHQNFTDILEQFVEAPSPNGRMDPRNKSVFALDAEMVLTTAGLELARLTLVSMDGEKVLDLFVKPDHQVVDPLTEYSGLTTETLEQAEDSLESARAKLFQLVNCHTILIGHSLECDLKALQLIHWNVVDTALLFLDNFGNKVRLAQLAEQYLGRTIQKERNGHCSYEDATACIDLIWYKFNNNMDY